MNYRWYLLVLVVLLVAGIYFMVRKTMSTQKTSAWLTYLTTGTATKNAGQFIAKDKKGVELLVEWHRTTVQEPLFAHIMKSYCDVACAAYTPVEVAFLKANADKATRDEYCQSFEPVFKDSPDAAEWQVFKDALKHNDWRVVEAKMPLLIKQLYVMDYAKFGGPDVYYLVSVKDRSTGVLLGFITFYVTPAYPYGDIKCTSFAIAPAEQNRGLGKLLMSSILKIEPACKRIFLSTRVTNDVALHAYRAWGFTPDAQPIQEPYFIQKPEHWLFFEYNVGTAGILQKAAAGLVG